VSGKGSHVKLTTFRPSDAHRPVAISLKYIPLFIFLLLVTLLNPQDNKLHLRKPPLAPVENAPKKLHPQQAFFDYRRPHNTKKGNLTRNNRLLVLLVEFQKDENPNTTGNGEFVLDPEDYPYPISLGKPPHDREYFETQIEAVRYYYLAASFGEFDLEYDVYPKEKQAYTLPNEMSYYNPTDSALFTQRTEQYFTEIFQIADSDPDSPPLFSYYDHYMIIHAGSDYQHDVAGDSFYDLPSYYMDIGDGKEVYVDDGTHAITHSANVPEYITQDVSFRYDVWRGVGLVNSVYVHEFGHSLGFADLYNTISGYPSVGMFDIMDSGGNGAILFEGEDGELYNIESILPTLPSVWSRLLAWEDIFIDKGYLVDIDYLSLQDIDPLNLPILASSAKRRPGENTPYFYRIRLSEDEYLLLENRSVDPDGDGGTSLVGALEITEGQKDFRAVLHPARYGNDYTPTYEYDFLLPSWVDEYIYPYGGGLLIWHIDDNQLYKQGEIVDGEFYNNLQINRVNTNIHGARAVRVIEADNLPDLGSIYSYFWTGTEWEYYFKFRPILENGYFVGWDTKIHNTELSSSSKPALKTNDGKPSSWKIYDISEAKRVMTFAIKNNLFDHTKHLGNFPHLTSLSNAMLGGFYAYTDPAIVISTTDYLTFYARNAEQDDFTEYDIRPIGNIGTTDFPIVTTTIAQFNFTVNELLLTSADTITFLSGLHSGEPITHTFDKNIAQTPIYHKHVVDGVATHYLGIVFTDNTSILYTLTPQPNFYTAHFNDSILIEPSTSFNTAGHFFSDGEELYFQSDTSIRALLGTYVDMVPSASHASLPTAKHFTRYTPVVAKSNTKTVKYLMSDDRQIYAINGYYVNHIFDLTSHTNEQSSQLALGYSHTRNSHFILFHTATKVFAITPDGSLYPGFPLTLQNINLNPDSTPYIISFNGDIVFLLSDATQGLLAVDLEGKIRNEYSLYWNSSAILPQFFIHSSRLYMLYADADENVFLNDLNISPTTKILWNGYKNNGQLFTFQSGGEVTPTIPIELYVYPNPVNKPIGAIRINNIKTTAKVNIYNVSGQNVFTAQIGKNPSEDFADIPFDTTNLSPGMYFVIANVAGQTYKTKFAVVR